MSRSIVAIYNPKAGARKRRRTLRMLVRFSRSAARAGEGHVRLARTEYATHATALAKAAVNGGADLVLATGGDGTVNETACGLLHQEVPMGIIPVGSGNGLARHLDIPLLPQAAFRMALGGEPIWIDSGMVAGRRFFTTAGVGLDAEVGWVFSKLQRRGFQSYLKATMQLYFSYHSRSYLLNIDGQEVRRKALLITFANASQFGNDAIIAPTARVDDGQLELVVVRPFPHWAIGYMASMLFQGILHKSTYVETRRFRHLEMQMDEPARGHVDGEPMMMPAQFSVSVDPHSLRVVAGPGAYENSGRRTPQILVPYRRLHNISRLELQEGLRWRLMARKAQQKADKK